MRHGRAKQARKTLQFFQRTIGIQSPYNVLIDGTFTVAMLQANLPLRERLDRLLQHGSSYQLFMTQSSLQELKLLAEHQKKKASASKESNQDDDDEGDDNNVDDPHEKLNVFDQAHAWAQEHCHILVDMPVAPERLDQVKMWHAVQQQQQQQKQEGRGNKRKRSRGKHQTQDGPLELTVAQNDMLRLVTDAVTSEAAEAPSSNSKSQPKNELEKQGDKDDEVDEKDEEDKRSNKSNNHNSTKQQPQRRVVYFVATQDETVLGILRQFTIPLIRLARGSVLLLEQPSKSIQTQDRWMEQQKWSGARTAGTTSAKHSIMSRQEQELLQVVAEQEVNEQAAKEKQQQQQQNQSAAVLLEAGRRNTKKRKAKGPNPLSCKKKKEETDGETVGKRGKRRKGAKEDGQNQAS